MKAEKAREIALNKCAQLDKDYKRIIDKIKYASERGLFKITEDFIAPMTINLLTTDGYKIEYHGGLVMLNKFIISW